MTTHVLLLVALSKRSRETAHLAIWISEKFNFNMEFFLRIDCVLRARTIPMSLKLIDYIHNTLAATIALIIKSGTAGSITRMRSRLERPLISFLKIELRAVVATHSISIAIVPLVIGPKWTTLVLAWHSNKIKRVDAATFMLSHTHVPLNTASKQIGREIIRITLVECSVIVYIAARSCLANVAWTVWSAPVWRDILCLRLSVNHNIDRKKIWCLLVGRKSFVLLWLKISTSETHQCCIEEILHHYMSLSLNY